MNDSELYVSHSTVFSGYQTSFPQADYVVVGVPFDVTSTFRTGARFAPLAIREASLNIESYSFLSDLDVEDLKIHDLGDLHISNQVATTVQRVEDVERDLLIANKLPVLIGGEHTITLGAVQGIGGKGTAVISFDAHLDLRNEYMGLTTSHTTFMRRLIEQVHPAKIVEVGTRAVCKEELAYAKEANVRFFTMKQIQDLGTESIIKRVMAAVDDCERLYLTIDMDVLDPAFAPAVQNPEPNGLSTAALLDLLFHVCDSRTIGLDVVEVTPSYDRGVTAIQAAKILLEAVCQIEQSRR